MAASQTLHRVAVVQRPPVLLDREETIRCVIAAIDEAASEGASLISFPETYLPGYPAWIWRLRPGPDRELTGVIHAALLSNAVDLSSNHLAPILAAARRQHVTVVLGLHELDGSFSRGTLYNTVVIIGPSGQVLNRHRKLMPTNPERMVWGLGDAAGLRVIETAAGRVGSLICWENYMPLARYALYAEGVQLYVAPTWDSGTGWASTMVHIAREGRCWVLGNGTSLQGRDVPADFPQRDLLFPDPDEWVNDGDSVIVAPDGTIVAGPLNKKHGVLYAECDPEWSTAAHRTLDVAGHYSRPDVFRLEVARESAAPVIFTGGPSAGQAGGLAGEVAGDGRRALRSAPRRHLKETPIA